MNVARNTRVVAFCANGESGSEVRGQWGEFAKANMPQANLYFAKRVVSPSRQRTSLPLLPITRLDALPYTIQFATFRGRFVANGLKKRRFATFRG